MLCRVLASFVSAIVEARLRSRLRRFMRVEGATVTSALLSSPTNELRPALVKRLEVLKQAQTLLSVPSFFQPDAVLATGVAFVVALVVIALQAIDIDSARFTADARVTSLTLSMDVGGTGPNTHPERL